MERVPPSVLTQHFEDVQKDKEQKATLGVEELQRLVEQKGWLYVKRMALEILKPYECEPPTTDAQSVKWDTYNKIRWSFERLFALVEQTAAGKGKENDAGRTN